MNNLPVIGAAMTLDELEIHRDWILDAQRDLELQDFYEAEVLNGDWSPLVERARGLLDGYTGRLGIHGPFWGLEIGSVDPEIRDVVAKRISQGLRVCEALGATQMVIHSPFTTWSHFNMTCHPGDFEGLVERCRLNLAEAVKHAEEIGCTMVFENIEDIDPTHRVVLADAFASPAVAVSLDTGHAHYAHGSHRAPPVDFYARVAGERLQHIHLQDADGYADRHWALGEGSVNWHGLFEALKLIETKPRLIVEIRDKTKIRASVAHLAGLGLGR